MPKRTNAFQKLITQIYKQMSTSENEVIESALIPEISSGINREVDILLQKKMFGTDIRIAIECRGRAHRDDIQWIDGLIGKYHDLPINKVIAVSKSGFSKSAIEKAHANHIDTLTLEEAIDTNWPHEFIKLGIAIVTRNDQIQISFHITENIDPQNNLSEYLYSEEGEQIGILHDIPNKIYQSFIEKINEEINKQFLSFYNTLDQITKKPLSVSFTVPPSAPIFLKNGEKLIQITLIAVTIICSFSSELIQPTHYILGDNQVTQATFRDSPRNENVTITALQDKNVPNQFKLSFTKAKGTENKADN